MGERVYFIHAPREDFAAIMTEEQAVWKVPFERLQRLLAEGVMILVGPTSRPFRVSLLRGRD